MPKENGQTEVEKGRSAGVCVVVQDLSAPRCLILMVTITRLCSDIEQRREALDVVLMRCAHGLKLSLQMRVAHLRQ